MVYTEIVSDFFEIVLRGKGEWLQYDLFSRNLNKLDDCPQILAIFVLQIYFYWTVPKLKTILSFS